MVTQKNIVSLEGSENTGEKNTKKKKERKKTVGALADGVTLTFCPVCLPAESDETWPQRNITRRKFSPDLFWPIMPSSCVLYLSMNDYYCSVK